MNASHSHESSESSETQFYTTLNTASRFLFPTTDTVLNTKDSNVPCVLPRLRIQDHEV